MKRARIILLAGLISLLLFVETGCQKQEQGTETATLDKMSEEALEPQANDQEPEEIKETLVAEAVVYEDVAIRMQFFPVQQTREPMSYDGPDSLRQRASDSFIQAESLLATKRDMDYSLVTTVGWNTALPYRDEQNYTWTLNKERISDQYPNNASYSLLRGDDIIYQFEAPHGYPCNIIKELIVRDTTWILGYHKEKLENNKSYLLSQIVVNGNNIGDQKGYDEVYFYGWVENKPFYIFKKGDQFSYVYEDKVTDVAWYSLLDREGDGSYKYTKPEKRSQGMFFQVQQDGYWGFVVLYSELISKNG